MRQLTPTPAAGLVATQVLPLKAWLDGQVWQAEPAAVDADEQNEVDADA